MRWSDNEVTVLGCDEGPGVCAMALTIVSLVLILASLPLSLFCVVKVVQVRNFTCGLTI